MPRREQSGSGSTAEEAPRADELVPDDPPEQAPLEPDAADKQPAVRAPVPAHGESASAEQLAEGEKALELEEADERR